MAKSFHTYDVEPSGRVVDPSEPGGRPAPGDDIQDQYNQLGGGQIGITNPGQGDDDYYWGPRSDDDFSEFEDDYEDDRWGAGVGGDDRWGAR